MAGRMGPLDRSHLVGRGSEMSLFPVHGNDMKAARPGNRAGFNPRYHKER